MRYLALLSLLTPVLGVVQLLLSRAVPPPPQVVTEVVEIPRNVYIEVAVPTVFVVERVVMVGPPIEVAPARQALADFDGYTEKNWTVQGYSSAQQMRETPGNNKAGWLKQTEAQVRAEEPAEPRREVGSRPRAMM